MTISSTPRSAGPFTGTGANTTFPFSYKVFARGDVLVARTVAGVEALLVLDSDYTVTLNPNQNSSPGGVIVLTSPLAVGATLAATSNLPIQQALDLTNNGGFYPTAINDALDRIVITIQQLAAKVGAGALSVGAAASIAGILNALTNFAGSAGASLVGFIQGGLAAMKRTVQDKLRESVSVKDFGAKADGTTDDATAIQACHDYCAGDAGKRVYYPAGNYYISKAIIVQSFANIYGDGPTKSRINLQGKAYTGDVFVNAVGASSWSFMSVQDIAIRGGACAFHCSAGTQEQWYFKNVSMELQTTAGILSDRDWQVNNFANVQWYYCFQGIRVTAGFNNHNSYYSPQFNGITGASLYCLSSNEGNNFYGARFEAGGLNGNITIQVANSRNLNFYGGYVENTHNNFLVETGSWGTSFYGLHWTGALTGGAPFIFSSDSEVTFGANSWGTASDGPAKIRITGDNGGKLGNNNTVVVSNSRNHKHSISPWIACPATLQKDLVTISKVTASGANTTVQAMTGILTVTYTGLETGGFARSFSRRYHVFASAVGFGTITPLLVLASSVDVPGSATLVVQVKAGATGAAATLEAVFTGLVPATQISSALQYSFEHTALSTTLNDYFKADLA